MKELLTYQNLIVIYVFIISVISILLTIYDKAAAQGKKRRIRESTLILFSLLGGSIAMLLTMKVIRHKTKHKKFMIGIPAIIILQIAVVLSLKYFYI